jgi:hypothetical protein
LPQELSRGDYIARLAAAPADWYQYRPDDAESLALRIGQLRQGCSMLLLCEHRPLTPDDREWLTENCRSWAARLEGYLIALETKGDPLIVRRQVDRTIEEISAALEKRGKQ